MAPLYLWNGMLLTENGALAISQDCCCLQCCSCPEGFPLNITPSNYFAASNFPCDGGAGEWNESSACPEEWSNIENLPEIPEQNNTPCVLDGEGNPLDFYWPPFRINYDFSVLPISSLDTTVGVTAGGAIFYLDTDKLENKYENCNLFAFIHNGYAEAQEYDCLDDQLVFRSKFSQTQQSCLQIVQILPEECDVAEPMALSATINDITNDIILSGVLAFSGIEASLNGNCVELFFYNEKSDGITAEGSYEEVIEGAMPPKYINPIVVSPVAYCGDCHA